jgi:hypothetical protein
MTQRQRQSAAATPPAALPCAPPSSRPPSWEDLFHQASSAQRAELLALAHRQGLVYASQLPLPCSSNGADRSHPRQVLTRLADAAGDLPAFSPAGLDFLDTELDDAQRDAVAKALSTPDLFLLQGLPGTGKSRVVSEIVTQAVRRGQRVLMLAPTGSAADRVLEEVARREGVLAIRCLAADEKLEELPPVIGGLTIGERMRALAEQSLPAARQEVETVGERCRRRQQDELALGRCRQLAEDWQQLDGQLTALGEQRGRIAADVEDRAAAMEQGQSPADAFGSAIAMLDGAFREAEDRCRASLTDLNGQCAEQERALAANGSELEAIGPLATAKEQGRWWSPAWWKATFAGDTIKRRAELQSHRQQITSTLEGLREKSRRVEEERAQAEQDYRNQRRLVVEAETSRIQEDLDRQESLLQQDRELLRQKWEGVCGELEPDTPRPPAPTSAAVEVVLQSCRQLADQDARHLGFAREWLAGLEIMRTELPQHLAQHANLIAGTSVASLDAPLTATHFDLLILEGAHGVTESEFVSAAQRTDRWVLVGEPAECHEVHAEATCGNAARAKDSTHNANKDKTARWGVSVVERPSLPGFFERLWRQLHCDPRDLPYAWLKENQRLCCRLRPVPPEQRSRLEAEHVADFPDIELRILASPDARPALAEVVFPPTMTIAQAKAYIYQELQELPIRASGRCLRWHEDAERVILKLSDCDHEQAVAVPLELGVRELVCPPADGPGEAGNTCCLEFERRSGWNRERAAEWVARYLRTRDTGRTVRLDVPHRMHPELAAELSNWLFPYGYRLPRLAGAAHATNGQRTPVEFVPVPPPVAEVDRKNGRRAGSTRPPSSKGGAGLELDLADVRHRDRLPSELRPELPALGLVNYLEAQAVVRTLEQFAREAGGRNGRNGETTIGVCALYPAQAELIRCLMRRSPILGGAAGHIRVGVPADFRERECHIALLSLTRSHSHRAVSFGGHPQDLVLALTRARTRLLVFGDQGTLARRAEWDGPVDHLDERSADRERKLLARLVRPQPSAPPTRALPRPQGSRP